MVHSCIQSCIAAPALLGHWGKLIYPVIRQHRDSVPDLSCDLLLQIASGSLICLDATHDEEAHQVASLDLEQLKVHVQLSSETTHAEVTVQEITVQDLGACPSSSADVVLTRWQQSGKQGHLTHLQLMIALHANVSCDA